MRAVRIGGKDIEIAGGALTPLAWHRAFGDDGLIDAAVAIEEYIATSSAEDAQAAEAGETPHYTAGLPAFLLSKLLYSMAWTADYAAGRQTLPFEAWLASIGEINVYLVAWEVAAEIQAGLFRA